MSELEKLQKQYEELREKVIQLSRLLDKAIPVQTLTGKDDVIIGEILTDKTFYQYHFNDEMWPPETWNIKQGMIVLFSNPPSEITQVYIVNYQLRQSQRTGKHYVKCFNWMTKEQLEETEKQRDQLASERDRVYEKIKEIEKWQKVQEFTEKMKQRGFTEEQVKSIIQLAEAGEYDAVAQILKKVTNAYAVLWRYNGYVVLSDQPFYISKEWSDHWSLKDIVFPMYFLPTNILSDTHEIFTEDQIFEGFECEEIANTIYQKHKVPVFYTVPDSGYPGELTVVLPRDSELLKKLKLTKEANLSNELKILVYAEILGLNLEEMAELSKYV